MKILLVADGFEATRPEETGSWLEDLASRLAHRGHRVTAVLGHFPDDDSPGADSPGVTIWRPNAGGVEPALLTALEQNPDVVHLASAGPWSAETLRALAASPLVLDAHGFWPVCAAGDLIQRPSMIECPHHHLHELCGGCAGLLHLRAMEERFPLGAEARVVISHTVAARDRLEHALGRPVECIRPGVDAFAFSPEPRTPMSPDIAALLTQPRPPRVLLLGDSFGHRGAVSLADLLVALNARVPEVQIVIPGCDEDDPAGPQMLLTEAREMGLLDQVHVFHGVPPEDAPALFTTCDLACLPCPLPTSGGLRVMQALSAGLPIVAHAGAAIGELVTHDVEGLLLPVEPLGAFANAVAGMLRDTAVRAQFADRCRLAAMERFDIERAVYAHEEVYHRARRRDGDAILRGGSGRRTAA